MRLKIKQLLMAGLFVIGIVLNSCSTSKNQTSNLQPSLTLVTSTPTRAISTLTVTPTGAISTFTITPTLTPADWYDALLTTSPTRYPLPTLPPDCGVVKLGGAGTQTIDNTQNILVQGTAILCGQIYFSPVDMPKTITVLEGLIDLDTGTFNTENADFWFCPGGGSMIFYYLCQVDNSEVKKYRFVVENGKVLDPKQPSFEECLGTKPYTGINDDEAKYACVVTTLGNISRVKVEQFNPLDHVMSIEISFITWER